MTYAASIRVVCAAGALIACTKQHTGTNDPGDAATGGGAGGAVAGTGGAPPTGGAGGGTGTGGAATGGTSGSGGTVVDSGTPPPDQLDCNQLAQAAGAYLQQASTCAMQVNDPCRVVPDADLCGCAVAVVNPDSMVVQQYRAVVAAQKKKGCDGKCGSVPCPPAARAACMKQAQESTAYCRLLPN